MTILLDDGSIERSKSTYQYMNFDMVLERYQECKILSSNVYKHTLKSLNPYMDLKITNTEGKFFPH